MLHAQVLRNRLKPELLAASEAKTRAIGGPASGARDSDGGRAAHDQMFLMSVSFSGNTTSHLPRRARLHQAVALASFRAPTIEASMRSWLARSVRLNHMLAARPSADC